MKNPPFHRTSIVNEFLSDWHDFLIQKVNAMTSKLLRLKLTMKEFHRMDMLAFAAASLYAGTGPPLMKCTLHFFLVAFWTAKD